MVFIRPKILRDGVQAAVETDSKYNYMREEQRKSNNGRELLPLLPGVPKPTLPEPPPPIRRERDTARRVPPSETADRRRPHAGSAHERRSAAAPPPGRPDAQTACPRRASSAAPRSGD